MKMWTIPVAKGQKFVANEYISACYNVWCVTPLDNEYFGSLVADSNGNNVYDPGVDKVEYAPVAPAAWVKGCGGKHEVRLQGNLPTSNGFVTEFKENPVTPVYFWYGDVIGENVEPENNFIENLHITDLSRPDAFTDVSNKS